MPYFFHAFSIPSGTEPGWLAAERKLKAYETHPKDAAEKVLDAWEEACGALWKESGWDSEEDAVEQILRETREAFEAVVQCWSRQDWGTRFVVEGFEIFVLVAGEEECAEWSNFEVLIRLGLMGVAGFTRIA